MERDKIKIEFVRYKVDDIKAATTELVHDFVRYSKIRGTEQWITPGFLSLIRRLGEEEPVRFQFLAEGITLSFSAFQSPLLDVDEDQDLIFRSPEPRAGIYESAKDIPPGRRNDILNARRAILEEMQDTYKLKLQGQELSFPKSEYAKEILIFEAPLLAA